MGKSSKWGVPRPSLLSPWTCISLEIVGRPYLDRALCCVCVGFVSGFVSFAVSGGGGEGENNSQNGPGMLFQGGGGIFGDVETHGLLRIKS